MCAHWHGLAKLRMHSDLTLDVMDEVTTDLGKAFRHFEGEICPAYNATELPREADARRRRHRQNTGTTGKAKTKTTNDGPRRKTFNLRIYKYHALGDYVRTIRRIGTSDSYSTTSVRIIYWNSITLVG